MSAHKSALVNVLIERGYLYQATDIAALDAALMQPKPLVGYVGFDCTAPSLHVGNMVSIMLLRRLQQAGGKPIVLIGGGTTKVGDPSGKDSSRPVLTAADIEVNKIGIRRVFEKFLTFGNGPTDALMLDNAEWLDTLNYISFLRDYGTHFTINKMLQLDSVKLRLQREQPLTFLEFNYMLLQAYDFLELYRRIGCRLQMGGSDQWGNIVNGADLVRRVEGVEAFGVTTPLITTASGAKMGKTAEGAVWLDGGMLAPYAFWQYWRNVEDADVGKFFKLFTDVPMGEIAKLEALQGAEINAAKIQLANEITTLVHGAEAAREAEATARATFSGGVGAALPQIEIQLNVDTTTSADVFLDAGLVSSKSEARRLAKEGALKVGDRVVEDAQALFVTYIPDSEEPIRLARGQKKHAIVRVVNKPTEDES